AIAAGGGDAADKQIFKKVVKKAAPRLSVGHAKRATSAATAVSATSAAHAASAASLGGQGLGGYEQASRFVRFSFTLPFGSSRDRRQHPRPRVRRHWPWREPLRRRLRLQRRRDRRPVGAYDEAVERVLAGSALALRFRSFGTAADSSASAASRSPASSSRSD